MTEEGWMRWLDDDNLTALERLATRATCVALCLAALFAAVVLYRLWPGAD